MSAKEKLTKEEINNKLLAKDSEGCTAWQPTEWRSYTGILFDWSEEDNTAVIVVKVSVPCGFMFSNYTFVIPTKCTHTV